MKDSSRRWRYVVATFVLLEFVLFFTLLPLRRDFDEIFEANPYAPRFGNRVDQDGWWPYAYGLIFVAAFYVCRGLILFRETPRAAWSWYRLLLLASLPYLWLFVSWDWYNEHATDLAYWLGMPLLLLGPPSFEFLFLQDGAVPPSARAIVTSTAIELLVVMPICVAIYPFLAIIMGFYWI